MKNGTVLEEMAVERQDWRHRWRTVLLFNLLRAVLTLFRVPA
jgi:hypothetical protein